MMSYRGEDLADGCFDLEFFGPAVHVSTDHVGHRLDMKKSKENQLGSTLTNIHPVHLKLCSLSRKAYQNFLKCH